MCYVFTWKKLREYLINDNQDPNSSNDFGKNIIPNMLENGEKMFAYLFSGYWKDVGTIDSLWEANMDLLAEKPELDLHDDNWRIYGRNLVFPPHFIGEEASVKNSILCDGCVIHGTVENSILSPGVTVEKGACVKDSIVMQQTVIRSGSCVTRAIVDEDVTILEDAKIGGEEKITVIGSELTIPKGAEIKAGEMLYPRVK